MVGELDIDEFELTIAESAHTTIGIVYKVVVGSKGSIDIELK